MWGTELEEDNFDNNEEFYNHEKAVKELESRRQKELAKLEFEGKQTQSRRAKILKLKRKVVYTYEYSDPSDDEAKKTKQPVEATNKQ